MCVNVSQSKERISQHQEECKTSEKQRTRMTYTAFLFAMRVVIAAKYPTILRAFMHCITDSYKEKTRISPGLLWIRLWMFYFLLLSISMVMMADNINTIGKQIKNRMKDVFSMMLFAPDFFQYSLYIFVTYVVTFLSQAFQAQHKLHPLCLR
jgi:hypothetical protein